MGVAGGVASRKELVLPRDNERDKALLEVVDLEFERKSELDLDLRPLSPSVTREARALSVVRN